MTTITTNHGTYTGRTLESIIRREYGRRAFVRPSRSRDASQAGQIIQEAQGNTGGYEVLAVLHSWEGRSEETEREQAEQEATAAALAAQWGAMTPEARESTARTVSGSVFWDLMTPEQRELNAAAERAYEEHLYSA